MSTTQTNRRPPDPTEELPSNIDTEKLVLGALLMDSARNLPDVRDLRPLTSLSKNIGAYS